MAAARQITVSLVGDSDAFVKSMGRAGDATKKLEKSTSDLGDQIEGSKKHFIGTKDVLDGLSETMGLPTEGAIGMARGFADLADGVSTTLIPAMKAGAKSVGAMGKAMLATPWGRVAAGVLVVGGAMAVASKDTDAFGTALRKTKEYAADGVSDWRGMANSALGFFGMASDKSLEFDYAMNEVGFNMLSVAGAAETLSSRGKLAMQTFGNAIAAAQASTARLDEQMQIAAQHAMALRIAAQLGGTVDDPDGAFASANAVAQMNDVMSGPIIPAAVKVGSATGKAQGNAHAAALKASLDKQTTILQTALDKFQAKLKAAKDFQKKTRSLFDLAFSGERDQFGSSVGGLADQVRKFERFIKVIGELRKKGLRESAVRSLIDGGVGNLDAATVMNSSSVRDQNKLIDQAKQLAGGFSAEETKRRTGVDVNHIKPVKVVLHVSGGDKELVNLIKKWVRKEGGGDVQLAFGGKR